MSELENPVCPNCENYNHVVLMSTAKRAGTALGGAIGVGATVFTGTLTILGSVVPVAGNITGGFMGSALAAFFTGAAIGNKCGEQIDRHFIRRYRCNKCQTEFEV